MVKIMAFVAALAAAATATPGLAKQDHYIPAATMLSVCHRALDDLNVTRDRIIPAGEAMEEGICMGVIQGVWLTAQRIGLICSPADATVGQVALMMVKRLEAQPQTLNQPFVWSILHEMQTAWPCNPPPKHVQK
jgi:Rap1a immunity proteins